MKVCTLRQVNEYMMVYDNPRSRSFIDLCPRSLRFNIFIFLFLKKKNKTKQKKNTWPFEAKFHMESPWDVGMKMCSNVQGHMAKMDPGPYMVKT